MAKKNTLLDLEKEKENIPSEAEVKEPVIVQDPEPVGKKNDDPGFAGRFAVSYGISDASAKKLAKAYGLYDDEISEIKELTAIFEKHGVVRLVEVRSGSNRFPV